MIALLRKYGLLETLVLVFQILRSKILVSKNVRIIKGSSFIIGKENIRFSKGFSSGRNLRLEALQVSEKRPLLSFGENVKMGWNVHIGCSENIEIQKNVLIGSNILITDHNHGVYGGGAFAHSSPEEIPDHRQIISKPVLIEENVWIGDMSIILPGVTLGKGAVIGAMSLVNKDVPPYCLVAGSPAKILKRFNFTSKSWERC